MMAGTKRHPLELAVPRGIRKSDPAWQLSTSRGPRATHRNRSTAGQASPRPWITSCRYRSPGPGHRRRTLPAPPDVWATPFAAGLWISFLEG